MFITLEGIEGSGKTTLIENLADVFRTLNHEVLVTREPDGCALGRELRQMLLNWQLFYVGRSWNAPGRGILRFAFPA